MDKKKWREKLNVNCVVRVCLRNSSKSISCRFPNTFNLVRNIISFALCAFIMQVHVQRTTYSVHLLITHTINPWAYSILLASKKEHVSIHLLILFRLRLTLVISFRFRYTFKYMRIIVYVIIIFNAIDSLLAPIAKIQCDFMRTFVNITSKIICINGTKA